MAKNVNKGKPDGRVALLASRDRQMSESMTDDVRRKSIVQACLDLGMSPEGAWSFSNRAVANKKAVRDNAAGVKSKSPG
ncbi:hypothetical protein E4191_23255 (plasmid) [Paracoccus liaowanqingii]|uniref:Uncharacterized protein n=1 Tax=Paracoccus liaowanqingii TaxID=2560053 RepID=A0A4Y5SVQ6_9RHOB|nr:hypothetical protein [Paracoccus liaowanqingii]QDA36958.1 hypothetical protein E4191_23255 [Paracoccus liaowanqingii]